MAQIRAARGQIKSDLVLKGGKVINVFTSEIIEADVACHGGIIVGIGAYSGEREINVSGRYLSPGFIDGHCHIESTMLSPAELARAVIPHGTSAIVADPHEIANVMGEQGISYMLEASEGLPLDIFFMLPSCVPATHLETAGAMLSANDLIKFKNRSRILGLAEMMNYPGVLSCDRSAMEKIEAFAGFAKDGHAPLLSGYDLNAYITAGMCSDHECTHLEEAREKLRLGMFIMIREGTQARNLKDLIPLITPANIRFCSFVTDDLHPHELSLHGHLDYILNKAINEGLDPVAAITMVTINTARHFGLNNLGALAPGYQADIAVLSSLKPVKVEMFLKKGQVLVDGGILMREISLPPLQYDVNPMRIKPYSVNSFAVPKEGGRVRVIGVIENQILTTAQTENLPVIDGMVATDTVKDVLKIVVVERHHGTGNIGIGFVRGFGLKMGAMASSVAHDSHNIICVGCTDADIYAAVKAVETMGGGLAVADSGKILASLPLPIAGLMSTQSLSEVSKGWNTIRKTAAGLGSILNEPFMSLSFLALPVIPELKITDKGLVDVARFEHVSLFLP